LLLSNIICVVLEEDKVEDATGKLKRLAAFFDAASP
jgi:hypothetical protein